MIKRYLFLLIIIFAMVFLLIGCSIFVRMNDGEFEDDYNGNGYINYRGCDDINSPISLTISPDNKNVYVGTSLNGISCYGRDNYSGWLWHNWDHPLTSNSVNSIIVSPDGNHVYASENNNIYWFRREVEHEGELIAETATNFISFTNFPVSMIISPDGAYIYGVEDTTNTTFCLKRDKTTGALTFMSSQSMGQNYIVISPDGKHIYVNHGTNYIFWFTRDFSTGDLTCDPASDYVTIPNGTNCFTVSPDGNFLYVAELGMTTGMIMSFKRNLNTGDLSDEKYQFMSSTNLDWMTISPDGKNIYATDSFNNQIDWYERDLNTGNLIRRDYRSGEPYMNQANCIIVTPDGRNVYATAFMGGTGNTGGVLFYERH